jgi:hypothetical protein
MVGLNFEPLLPGSVPGLCGSYRYENDCPSLEINLRDGERQQAERQAERLADGSDKEIQRFKQLVKEWDEFGKIANAKLEAAYIGEMTYREYRQWYREHSPYSK